jgi:hypothetical protein
LLFFLAKQAGPNLLIGRIKTITKTDRPEKLRGKKGGQLFSEISILIFLSLQKFHQGLGELDCFALLPDDGKNSKSNEKYKSY